MNKNKISVEKDPDSFYTIFTLNNNNRHIATSAIVIFTISGIKKASLESMVIWKETDRGKGYGRELIEYMIEYCKNNQIKTIIVHPDKNAIGFYEKHGFTISEDVYQRRKITYTLDIT